MSRLLTYRDVASRYAVSVMTVRRMAERGDLPKVRIGGSVLWDPAARTSRGVGIGDPLSRARDEYALKCRDESSGSDYFVPAQCEAQLGPGRFIGFVADEGTDRIGAIALSAEPLTTGCDGGWPPKKSRLRRCKYEARTGRSARR